ncbi:MAG TPA: zinc-ribbon domain-containing protein [Clostridia bacterium]|nr:zinc-ribbon domain-containing protein [Clostridia bacterium]
MDLLNDIGKKITETAKSVTKKSEDIVEITKLNLTIGSEEDKIKRMFYEIGSELYRSYTNGKPIGDFYDSKCNEVKQIEENIKAIKERILLLKGNKICKTCNTVVDAEVNYCPNCGEKLEKKED